jgi:hypothetical protein
MYLPKNDEQIRRAPLRWMYSQFVYARLADAKVVDKALAKLFSSKMEGQYCVSYLGLDDEMNWKVYNNQNWYKMKVEVVPVSGFKNIDRQHEIGMNQTWPFREFVCEQPNSLTKVLIDINNGSFKIKGIKILVLSKYKKDAQ